MTHMEPYSILFLCNIQFVFEHLIHGITEICKFHGLFGRLCIVECAADLHQTQSMDSRLLIGTLLLNIGNQRAGNRNDTTGPPNLKKPILCNGRLAQQYETMNYRVWIENASCFVLVYSCNFLSCGSFFQYSFGHFLNYLSHCFDFNNALHPTCITIWEWACNLGFGLHPQ